MLKSLQVVLLLLLTNTICKAQNTLVLLNGKEVNMANYEVKGIFITFKKSSDASAKNSKYNLERVFSIKDSLLGEKIYYFPDTVDDYELNIGDMRTFIDGEQYARKHYKKPLNAVVPAAIGLTSAGFLGVYALLVPFGYVGIASAFNTTVPLSLPDEPANINEPYFKAGYQYRARKKKAQDGFLFGGLGVVVGLSVFFIFVR